MKNIIKNVLHSIILALAIVSFCRTALSCQVDECFLTRAGYYLASSSTERLKEANSYETAGNKEKLDELLKNKIVLRLKDDVKVQALEWSIELKMIKIKFDDSGETYWVNDGALRQINTGDKGEIK